MIDYYHYCLTYVEQRMILAFLGLDVDEQVVAAIGNIDLNCEEKGFDNILEVTQHFVD